MGENKTNSEGKNKSENTLMIEAMIEAIDRLKKDTDDFREVIPQERNFSIQLQESESELGKMSVRLRHKETGREKDLNAFLPPEYSFEKDRIFCREAGKKEIGFPENELQFRGFLLALFHEISHAHEKHELLITNWEVLKILWEGTLKWLKSIRIKKEVEQNGKNKKIVYTIKSLPIEALLPKWYLNKRSYAQAKLERNAWALALKLLRKLKQEGYDVFAGFENAGEIMAYIDYCLYTYHLEQVTNKLIAGVDFKEVKELIEHPVFLRKYKIVKVLEP